MVARRNTRQTILVFCRLLDDSHRILHDGVYLRIVLLHVTLTQFKERTLSILHEFVHINRIVESLRLDAAGIGYQLARQRLLCDDTCMILDIS